MSRAASTTAAFIADGQLHALRYVKLTRLGQCGVQGSPGDGLYYVPSWAFDGRHLYGDLPVCRRCGEILADPAGSSDSNSSERPTE